MPFFRITRFLDVDTCRRIRGAMDRGRAEPAEILEDAIALDAEVRRAASIEVDDETLAEVEQHLDAVRHVIGEAFNLHLAGREGAGFLRYAAGGFYRPHVDRARVEAWPEAAERAVSVVVFLNGGIDGGELSLVDDEAHVAPEEGLLVAFDAGALHQVQPVRAGTRDVIVDWFRFAEAGSSSRR